MRDGARVLDFLGIYKDFTLNLGYNFDDFWYALMISLA